jgi:hypothetical protein
LKEFIDAFGSETKKASMEFQISYGGLEIDTFVKAPCIASSRRLMVHNKIENDSSHF